MFLVVSLTLLINSHTASVEARGNQDFGHIMIRGGSSTVSDVASLPGSVRPAPTFPAQAKPARTTKKRR